MRIFGDLSAGDRFEIHISDEWADPPRYWVFWKSDHPRGQPEQPTIRKALVVFKTWESVTNEPIPLWLIDELEKQKPLCWEHSNALHVDWRQTPTAASEPTDRGAKSRRPPTLTSLRIGKA
jgi:hypothetical protein